MEDSPCFSSWYYLTRVPVLSSLQSSLPSPAGTVHRPILPHQSALHAAMAPSWLRAEAAAQRSQRSL